MEHFYSAREAAERLGLKYHTFLARAHRGKYQFDYFGDRLVFPKQVIDQKATENAPDRTSMEEATR